MSTTTITSSGTTSLIRPIKNNSRPSPARSRPLVGNFEENILNNRLEPIRTVDGYTAEVRASYNQIQPSPLRSKVRVSFFSAGDCFPYLGQVFIGHRGYKIPKKGTLQVTLFNPNGTIVKLFLLHYDLTDMPANSQTFLRQKTLLLLTRPVNSTGESDPHHELSISATTTPSPRRPDDDQPLTSSASQVATRDRTIKSLSPSRINAAPKRRVKYMIQLNIVSSKSGRIYLNKDLRIFISKKVDLETATQFAKQDFELKSFDEMPSNPRYFTR